MSDQNDVQSDVESNAGSRPITGVTEPADDGAGAASGAEPGESPSGSPVLKELYEQLGRAHAVGEDLLEQDRQALQEIDAAEKRLTSEREESEAAEDSAKVAAIDADLDQLREAYLTIKDRLGDADEQQDDDGQPGQRDGDGDEPDPGRGPADSRADDRGQR